MEDSLSISLLGREMKGGQAGMPVLQGLVFRDPALWRLEDEKKKRDKHVEASSDLSSDAGSIPAASTI